MPGDSDHEVTSPPQKHELFNQPNLSQPSIFRSIIDWSHDCVTKVPEYKAQPNTFRPRRKIAQDWFDKMETPEPEPKPSRWNIPKRLDGIGNDEISPALLQDPEIQEANTFTNDDDDFLFLDTSDKELNLVNDIDDEFQISDTIDSSGDTQKSDTTRSISIPPEMENYSYNIPHHHHTNKHAEYIDFDQELETDNDELTEVRAIERHIGNVINQENKNKNISQNTQSLQYVTIDTHNICGLTEKGTQQQLPDHIYPDFIILELSEMKLTTSNDLYIVTKDDPYFVFWAFSILLL